MKFVDEHGTEIFRIEFEPTDCWIGLFWKNRYHFDETLCYRQYFLCIVPCFPIIWIRSYC